MAKTLGVLVLDVEGAFSKMIWPEIAKYAKFHGFDLVVLPASNPKYPYSYLSKNNSLFNFVNNQVIDALIFIPSIIGNFLKPEVASALINRIQDSVQVISINTVLKDSPHIMVDNVAGIKDAVAHCIHSHNYSRIGFVCGPEKNLEAIERKNAFINSMIDEGITPNPDWFFPGDFTSFTSSTLALEQGERLVKEFDALICANDHTAAGIINTLHDMGYSIPKDLAVIGFDDMNEAPYFNPPLTTIKQPFTEMVHKASEYAIDLCMKKKVPLRTDFKTKLIIRSSCGCENFLCNEISKSSISQKIDQLAPQLVGSILSKYLPSILVDRIYLAIYDLLLILINNQPTKKNRQYFLVEFELLLNEEFFIYKSLPDWQTIFTILIDIFIDIKCDNLNKWNELNIFERSRLLISKKIQHFKGSLEIDHQEHFTLPLRKLQQTMTNVTNHNEILETLAGVLPSLGVKNCFVSLMQKGLKKRGLYSTLEKESSLVFAYTDGIHDSLVSISNPISYETLELLPRKYKPVSIGNIWIVGALYYQDELYGFVITDVNKDSEIIDAGVINESIRHQLSISIHRCYINQKRELAETQLKEILSDLKLHNKKLEKDSINDEMTGLLNRRGFFQEVEKSIGGLNNKSIRYALFFSDMDGLKTINDTLGHNEGDIAIKDMAELFKNVFREEDFIARLGGDEFTIFTLNVPENFEDIIAKRINRYLNDYSESSERKFKLSISIGCEMGIIKDNHFDLQSIMKKADEKLYDQKKSKKRKN